MQCATRRTLALSLGSHEAQATQYRHAISYCSYLHIECCPVATQPGRKRNELYCNFQEATKWISGVDFRSNSNVLPSGYAGACSHTMYNKKHAIHCIIGLYNNYIRGPKGGDSVSHAKNVELFIVYILLYIYQSKECSASI